MRTIELFTLACIAINADAQGGPPPRDRPTLFGDDYELLTAAAKYQETYDLINGEGVDSVTDIPWTELGRFFTQVSGKSLIYVGDDMPRDPDHEGRRKKLVHQQGLVAPVRLVPNRDITHPFTGIFEGADLGFARISESGFGIQDNDAVNPSAAIKFFRDTVPSANMVFMNSFESQPGKDFFAHELRTHPAPITNDDCRDTAQRKLTEPTRFPFSQGTTDWCAFDQYGVPNDLVDENGNRTFPFQIILRATPSLKAASAGWAEGRTDWGSDYFQAMVDDLLILPFGVDGASGSTLWEVYAQANPEDGEDALLKVATIEATESFTASLWADEKMYFKHEGWNTTLQKLEDRRTRRAWDTFESLVPHWGDQAIALPDNDEEAKAVITDGILNSGCPFAWLLETE